MMFTLTDLYVIALYLLLCWLTEHGHPYWALYVMVWAFLAPECGRLFAGRS